MYSLWREKIRSGAILLFSGGGLVSEGIKAGTLSEWSHVGMAVWLQQFDELVLCVWESTTLNKVKTIDGVFRKGVQTVPLSNRVDTYEGKIAFRNPSRDLTDVEFKALMKFRNKVKGRAYEESKLQLLKSAFDLPAWLMPGLHVNDQDLSSLFCSELVAEVMKDMGLISTATPSNEFTPADFSEGRSIDRLVTGIEYGPEKIIKDD